MPGNRQIKKNTDAFTAQLNNKIIEIITNKIDDQNFGYKYPTWQLLLLMIKPDDRRVKQLKNDPLAKKQAVDLYKNLSGQAMLELSQGDSEFNKKELAHPDNPSFATTPDLPPSYVEACNVYLLKKKCIGDEENFLNFLAYFWYTDPLCAVDLASHMVFAADVIINGAGQVMAGAGNVLSGGGGGGDGCDCGNCGEIGLIIAVVIVLLSGLVYALNESLIILQNDSNWLGIGAKILPTFILAAGAGYMTYLQMTLFLGATVSPLGLGLAVAATVILTAGLVTWMVKHLSRCCTYEFEAVLGDKGASLREQNINIPFVENQINQRVKIINELERGIRLQCLPTKFFDQRFKRIRQLKEEIELLKDTGSAIRNGPPSYDAASLPTYKQAMAS